MSVTKQRPFPEKMLENSRKFIDREPNIECFILLGLLLLLFVFKFVSGVVNFVERRVIGLEKRIQELGCEVDVANGEMEEVKCIKETTEQELKGYELQLALNEASIQTLEVCFIYLLYLYLIRFFYWIMNVLYAFRQESPWDILGWIPSRGSEGSMIACCSLSLFIWMKWDDLHFLVFFFLFVILVLNLIAWVIVLGRDEEWRRSFTVKIAVYFTCHSLHPSIWLFASLKSIQVVLIDVVLATCFCCLCRDEFIRQMFDLNAKIRLVSLTRTYVTWTGNLCSPCLIYNCTLLWLTSWFWRCFLLGRWIAVWMRMIC